MYTQLCWHISRRAKEKFMFFSQCISLKTTQRAWKKLDSLDVFLSCSFMQKCSDSNNLKGSGCPFLCERMSANARANVVVLGGAPQTPIAAAHSLYTKTCCCWYIIIIAELHGSRKLDRSLTS